MRPAAGDVFEWRIVILPDIVELTRKKNVREREEHRSVQVVDV